MRISQREARRLRKRLTEVESRIEANNRAWSSDYPGGTQIDTITISTTEWHIINTALKCGRAVIVKPIPGEAKIIVYAVRP